MTIATVASQNGGACGIRHLAAWGVTAAAQAVCGFRATPGRRAARARKEQEERATSGTRVRDDRPVRVLFLNTRSALGADVAVHWTIARNLDPAACEAIVATNARAADLDRTLEELRPNPALTIVPMRLGFELSGRGRAARMAGAAGNLAELAGGLGRLATLVRRRGVDVVHVTDRPRDALAGVLLGKLTRRKSLVHVHIKWYPEIGKATNWALRNCDAVLAISRFVEGSLRDGGVPPAKLFAVLNATDASRFDPRCVVRGRFRQRIGVAPDEPLVGIVARIMKWKGHLELVEAMARVRRVVAGARLAVIGVEDRLASGGESYAEGVRSRAAELGVADAIVWAGWHDAMPEVFADLDVVCVPSYEEPFGLVVTEALSMERPVVGFASGALPEIITDGVEGRLVPALDVERLADAIVGVLQRPVEAAEMGRRGRQRVLRDFQPGRQAAEVTAVYHKVAGLPEPAAAPAPVAH